MKNYQIFLLMGSFIQLYSMENLLLDKNEIPKMDFQIIDQHNQRYFCMECGEKFDEISFKSHHHAEIEDIEIKKSNKANYICEKCNTPYSNITGLKWHMAKIHKEGPYKCSICGKVFPYLRYFQSHTHKKIKEKTVKEPIDCANCLESFSNQDSLKSHLATVHKEGLSCNYCSRIYARQHAWWKHVMNCRTLASKNKQEV